jgi:hypothetical protein
VERHEVGGRRGRSPGQQVSYTGMLPLGSAISDSPVDEEQGVRDTTILVFLLKRSVNIGQRSEMRVRTSS